MNIALCGIPCKLAHFIVLDRKKNKSRLGLEKQINMDFSPPPFHSSSSWYVLWAFCIGSIWQGERQGCPGYSLGVEGRGPCGLLSSAPLCCAPSSPVFPRGPFFRCTALLSGDDFYLEWRGGSFCDWVTTICSQFLFAVAVSLDWFKRAGGG